MISRVAELAAAPAAPGSEYLLGQQPTWDDIRVGRAVERVFEEELPEPTWQGCVLVTGTAGAGTTTTLMHTALKLAAEGRNVYWVDALHEYGMFDLQRFLRRQSSEVVVVIDDADTFGSALGDFVSNLEASTPNVLLVLGMRSNRVDEALPQWSANCVDRFHIDVPPLMDSDIDRLIGALDRDNKLGELAGKSHDDRVRVFRDLAGRQILPAMIRATPGEELQAKAAREFDQLSDLHRTIYALACLATAMRQTLRRNELLIAAGSSDNETLYAIDRLAARRLIVRDGDAYTARHRMVADIVVTAMRNTGQLLSPYTGLLRAMGVVAMPDRRGSRATRMVTWLLSHRRIISYFNLYDARSVYDSVEEILKSDYHYWLQRGSLEVQYGSLPLAENYLQQARAGCDNDRLVIAEWAYLQLKTAVADPARDISVTRFAEGRDILLEQIEKFGRKDSYPYHILGSQSLAWIRRSALSAEERRAQLAELRTMLDTALKHHPVGTTCSFSAPT